MNCASCGAAMAADQRYCLNCGQRRGEARVDFRRHVDASGPRGAAPGRPAAGKGAEAPAEGGSRAPKPQRDYAPLAAAGGIAVLGVMLLIGVLIGRGTGSGSESAATPQVITVDSSQSEGGGNGGAGGAASETAEGSADKAGKKGSGGGKKRQKSANATGTGKAPVASDDQLEALQAKTGEEYAEESAKLPDEIATPGAPPPEDGKAPGGGSGGTTIE